MEILRCMEILSVYKIDYTLRVYTNNQSIHLTHVPHHVTIHVELNISGRHIWLRVDLTYTIDTHIHKSTEQDILILNYSSNDTNIIN